MHLSFPQQETDGQTELNKTFIGWLKKQSLLLTSQVAVIFGIVYTGASLLYYIRHGEYYGFLEPRTIQNVIFWLHIPLLLLFIAWSIWIKEDDKGHTRAKRTFNRVFKRDLTKNEAKHGRRQLNSFKRWFLYFWISMCCLYGAFIIQRNLQTPKPISKDELFRMFNKSEDKKEHSQDGEKAENTEKDLEEKVKIIEEAIENTPDAETNLSEYEIYSEIKTLKDKHLKDRIDAIAEEIKKPVIYDGLGQVTTSKRDSEALRYKGIYDKILAASSESDNKNQKILIEKAKEEIAPLLKLQNTDLTFQERYIFTRINNLDTKELEKSFDKIAASIDELERGNIISKSEKLRDKIREAHKITDPVLLKESVKEANDLLDKDDKHSRKLYEIIFACITYGFNNLGWWIIYVCFIFTTTLDSTPESRERQKNYIVFSFFGLIILFLTFPGIIFSLFLNETTEPVLTSWTVFFDGFSGIMNSVVLALLIARLDSKLIGLPSYLIGVLYFYAAFQPLFVVFEQPGEISQLIKTVVLVAVFISKIYFFLIITYAIQTGRILTYLYCYPTLSKRVDTIFANPFRIYCEETATSFKFKIMRKEEPLYEGEYKRSEVENEAEFYKKIVELRKYVEKEKDSEVPTYVRIVPMSEDKSDDKNEIKICDENGEVMCETTHLDLSKKEADKLRDESIKYIPHCEPEIINIGKQQPHKSKTEKIEIIKHL